MSLILDGTTGVPVTTVTGTLPVANGGTGGSTSTGTGAVVLTTSPTISAPVLSGTTTGTYSLGGTPTITSALSVALPGSGASDYLAVTLNNLSSSSGRSIIKFVGHGGGRTDLIGGAEGSAAGYGTFTLGVTDNSGNLNKYIYAYGESYSNYLSFWTGSSAVATNTEKMRIDSSGGLILSGSTAQKATGTTWSNPSDVRLKDNIRDYAKGTTELMQVRVREWEYNGKGNTIAGIKGLGVVADEVMVVLPDTVENYKAKLNADDEQTTQIKKFDATEITWLLVKTAQEQQALITAQAETINALTARVVALEGI